MSYYVMVGEGPYPSVSVAKGPDLPGGPWYHGKSLVIPIPEYLEYILDVEEPYYDDDDDDDDEPELIIPPSRPKVLINSEAFPVMRDDLLKALQDAGVNNLETFPARLIDEVNSVVHENYIAFNIVGLVSAADLSKSELMSHAKEVSLLDTDFHSLAIDESKAHGILLFRLAENCSTIIVHEKIKREVEKRNIPGVVFYASGEWSG